MLKYSSIVIFILTCSAVTVKAQTGLFGKNNAVEFSYSLAPSLKAKTVLITQQEIGNKYRLINNTFTLKYKRIVSNRLSFSIGYDFAKIRSFASGISQSNVEVLETYYNEFSGTFETGIFKKNYSWDFIEPKFSYNAVSVGFDYFNYNSINPIGLFWGLDLEVGRLDASFDNVLAFNTTVSGGSTPSFIVDNSIREISLDSNSRTYTTVLLRGTVGRNIIISRSLVLNLNLKVNLLSFISGYNVKRSSADFFETLEDSWNTTISYSTRRESSLVESAYASLLAYKRFSIGAGLRYYF